MRLNIYVQYYKWYKDISLKVAGGGDNDPDLLQVYRYTYNNHEHKLFPMNA